MKLLIPARKNSKGIPYKNRMLFEHTAHIIPDKYKQITYVFSDDEVVNSYADEYGFSRFNRDDSSAQDESTTKDMMLDFCSNLEEDESIVMLYLTYPNRKWSDVSRAIDIFDSKGLSSLLCRQELKQSPYLMMFELEDGRGEQIIKHNFSRRQDYRKCFEISHCISIINKSELQNLNNDLYNKDTYFMEIEDQLDIDFPEDIKCLQKL